MTPEMACYQSPFPEYDSFIYFPILKSSAAGQMLQSAMPVLEADIVIAQVELLGGGGGLGVALF
jgi:hypothetical protein